MMGSISRLAMMCIGCPKVETCNHKRMEALAYIELPVLSIALAGSLTDSLAIPNARETITIRANGQKMIVYKEDFLKNLNSEIGLAISKNYLGGSKYDSRNCRGD